MKIGEMMAKGWMVAWVSLALAASARAALLAYEPFTNAPGAALIGTGGGRGFAEVWQPNGSGGLATQTVAGLTYADPAGNALVTAGGAGFFQGLTTANTSMQPTRAFAFSRGTNGTDGAATWISFLVTRTGPTNGTLANPYLRGANVPHDLGALQKLAVGNSSGALTNTLGLIPQGSGASLKASAVPFGHATNFVVVRLDHLAGANDHAWLFVNPNLAVEPATNAADASSLGGFDFSFDRVRIFAGGQSSVSQPYAEMVVDEYRVGETYADVTPYHPATPEVSGLRITNATLAGGKLVLAGTGGESNRSYLVLSSTNVSAGNSNWLALATNQFDGEGCFRCTNAIMAGPGAGFFRILMAVSSQALAANYYVAVNGSDSNPGTNINAPFATLARAAGLANPGHLIYVRGGTYNWAAQVELTRNGTPPQPIRVFAYPGETPVFDFAEQTNGYGISIGGKSWHLKGLEIANAADTGLHITGSSNTVERCVLHGNRDTGLQLRNATATYNLILNCDSYRNYDPAKHGENADGFTAKFSLGPGNVFSGCRAWENSDDGWDLWQATGSVVLTNCWSWRNGTNAWGDSAFAGDGNGIKLGGDYYYGPHVIYRCMAFKNPGAGFDQNNNNAGQTLYNNTAWANGKANFNLNHGTNITSHVLCNNLSIAGGSSDSFRSDTLATNNSWQVLSPAASTSDVMSTLEALARLPRQADGSLPVSNFLRPVAGGRLVDAGVPVGLPYNGAAPDLGAVETGF